MLKYERLFLEEIDDVLDLAIPAEHYRVDYDTVSPHEDLSWNRSHDVHIGGTCCTRRAGRSAGGAACRVQAA